MDDDHIVGSIYKSVSVLDACHWIADSLKDISPTTVAKCFANAGFSVDPGDSSVDDPEDDLSLAQLTHGIFQELCKDSLTPNHR